MAVHGASPRRSSAATRLVRRSPPSARRPRPCSGTAGSCRSTSAPKGCSPSCRRRRRRRAPGRPRGAGRRRRTDAGRRPRRARLAGDARSAPYRSAARHPTAREQLAALSADAVLFASGSAARAWVEVFGTTTPPVVVAMGRRPPAAAVAAGLTVTDGGQPTTPSPASSLPSSTRWPGATTGSVGVDRRRHGRRRVSGLGGGEGTHADVRDGACGGSRRSRRHVRVAGAGPGREPSAAHRGRRRRAAVPAAPNVPSAVPPVVVLPDAARTPSVSADGRLRGLRRRRRPTTTGARASIWLLDRSTGDDHRAHPVRSTGLRAGNSVRPAISADGCHVVVVTEIPYDLFRDDDTGARWDVYQLTLPACGGTPVRGS